MRTNVNRLAVGALVVLAACTSEGPDWQLPDRNAAEVQAEERRIAELLASEGYILSEPGGRCDVRLLGSEDQFRYVWAECTKGSASASYPVVVSPDGVAQPKDGSEYADSIRLLFPRGLADDILEHQDRLRP